MLEIFSESYKIAKKFVSDKIGKYQMATFGDLKKACCAGCSADPSRCITSSRQKPTIQQNSRLVLNKYSNLDALHDLESVKKYKLSLFYDWKHYLKPFGRDGAVNIF